MIDGVIKIKDDLQPMEDDFDMMEDALVMMEDDQSLIFPSSVMPTGSALADLGLLSRPF